MSYKYVILKEGVNMNLKARVEVADWFWELFRKVADVFEQAVSDGQIDEDVAIELCTKIMIDSLPNATRVAVGR